MKKHYFLFIFLSGIVLFSCKKEGVDKNQYQVNSTQINPPDLLKNKHKTNEQYVAILHANLFQTALSANELFEVSQCIESIGDKETAREVLISNFMNKPGVIIPLDSVMRTNLDKFITETYNRFLVRNPSEAEKTWFRNYITSNPNVTPEIVYFSFALSEEYLYY